MPTWDEITPDLERWTRPSRLTCTNILIGVNVVCFLLSGILPRILQVNILPLYFDAHRAIGSFWLWQFFTYSFVQLVDIWFMFWFILGAYTLYQIGNDLEREVGAPRILVIYFASAAYGALVHAIYQYVSGSAIPALSFFGPVFGVVITYAMRYPSRSVLFFFIIPMRLMTAVLLTGAIVVFYCAIEFKSGTSPFSILGAAAAALAIHKIEPWIDRRLDSVESRRDRERIVEGVELRRQVDLILEKISKEGMGALTRQERKLLEQASQTIGHDRGTPND